MQEGYDSVPWHGGCLWEAVILVGFVALAFYGYFAD
jgi:hypothetical protein